MLRRVRIEPTFASFRDAARALLAEGVPPRDVTWDDGTTAPDLFAALAAPAAVPAGTGPRVPAAFVRQAEHVAQHADPERWALLHRVAYRLTHGEPELLEIAGDADVARLRAMKKAVDHEIHRMHAFVRFHETPEGFVAFYEPAHDVAELAAPHFVARYPSMRWVIMTPQRTVAWNGEALRTGAGAARSAAPRPDELGGLFAAYYGAIFNPARTNLEAFGRHVPARYHRDMPELHAVHTLAREAEGRVTKMADRKASPSSAFVPADADQHELVRASRGCTACDLYKHATQTVFGEGPTPAPLMLVGEQPGDQEDQQGHPFVGPAGRVLDQALESASIPRDQVYVTNAVKHFKWEPRGKRRLHQRPNAAEIHACNGWLQAEIEVVRPQVIVCLGATAAQAFLGRAFSVTRSRGEVLDGAPWAPHLIATYHPSALLRMMRDEASYEDAKAAFEADLAKAASLVTFGRARAKARARGRAARS